MNECDHCEKAINASRPSYTAEVTHQGVRFSVVFCTRKCEKAWKAEAKEKYQTVSV